MKTNPNPLTATGLLLLLCELDLRYLEDYICHSATKAYAIIMCHIALKTSVAYSVLGLSMVTSDNYAKQH